MIAFYTDVFAYHHKYNQIVIKSLLSHPDSDLRQSMNWMAHVLEAHHIWLNRIINKKDGVQSALWSDRDRINYHRTLNIIKYQPMDHPIRYKNSMGDSYINTISEILYHIVNHTAHHRGMIIADIRRAGIEPPVTDYIFDKR